MSENRPARVTATSLSCPPAPRLAAAAALAVALLLVLCRPAWAQADGYVAPLQAPQVWLEPIGPEDREPLEEWVTFLPPQFDERLRWIDLASETRRMSQPKKWSDWYGKVIVIQSWSHTDDASVKRVNDVAAVVNEFSDIDVQFIALHTPDGARTSPSFILNQPDWPHINAIDVLGDFCDLLGVYKTPVNIVIGRNGAVRYAGLHTDGLREAIDHLLEEDSHSAPCRGWRPISLSPSGGGGYPAHNPQPRANNLQGRRAPDFFVQSWANHAPDQIEGRVNVIKFWRTNCPFCISAIPKTDALSQKYAGRVNFIGITHENSSVLEQGLRQRGRPLDAIKHSIAIDTSSRMRQAVGSQVVPNAMIVDSDWTVRWQGNPADITEQMLDQILAGDGGAGGGEAIVRRWGAPEPALAGSGARPVEAQRLAEPPRLGRNQPQPRQQPERRAPQADAAGYPAHNQNTQAARDLQGQRGPDFAVESWVTGAPEKIEGNVNVIKFWRTSCGACMNALPRTSEKAQQFAGRVNFIDVTYENEATMKQGLANRSVSLDSVNQFVAIDTGARMQRAVGPQGVPYAIVLDKNWIVRWQGHPNVISEEMLEQILRADESGGAAPTAARTAAPRPAAADAPRADVRPVTRRRIEFGPAEFPPVTGDVRAAVDLRGKPGPEFQVQQWITAQPMRVGGKVTVIEFWRTTCPFCRTAIPKLNDINTEFGGAIDIILVSTETKDAFESGMSQFQMSNRSFNVFVALDHTLKMYNTIRPAGVPHAIVLDSDWIVRWQGNPHHLTGDVLEQIVKADAWKRRQGS